MSFLFEGAHPPICPRPLHVGLRHKTSHQSAPGPSVPAPPTQLNLGNGQGNLPSDFVLSSRDLGRLNPGLSESCNFNFFCKRLLPIFKAHCHRRRSSPLFASSHVCQALQRAKNKWSETPRHQSPRLVRQFGSFGSTSQMDSCSSGQDCSQSAFTKSALGFSELSPVQLVRQSCQEKMEERQSFPAKCLLCWQLSLIQVGLTLDTFTTTLHQLLVTLQT